MPTTTTRRCNSCGVEQEMTAFRTYPARSGPPSRRRKVYGLSQEEYDALVLESEGRCAICNRPTPDLKIDHDHATGRVRGLLCQGCNSGLGHLGDTVTGLLRALAYLRR